MAPARIEDEFTDLSVSRRRKYQLRQAKRGLCANCREKATHRSKGKQPLCNKHYRLFRDRMREGARCRRAQGKQN